MTNADQAFAVRDTELRRLTSQTLPGWEPATANSGSGVEGLNCGAIR
jgi:hypothetical protein